MFSLSEKDGKAFSSWLEEHNKTCPFKSKLSQGAIGGRLTYKFTPTNLGLITKIECGCGSEVDVTDYSEW